MCQSLEMVVKQTAGENHMLTCQVTGGGTMTTTYQWLKDGASLSGQTSETLSFSPLRQMDNGSYTCEATRSSISVTSTGVSITVVGEFEWPCIIMEVTLTVSTAPALLAVITASGPPDEGQIYSLTCELRGADLLAITNPRFRWGWKLVEQGEYCKQQLLHSTHSDLSMQESTCALTPLPPHISLALTL